MANCLKATDISFVTRIANWNCWRTLWTECLATGLLVFLFFEESVFLYCKSMQASYEALWLPDLMNTEAQWHQRVKDAIQMSGVHHLQIHCTDEA